MYIYIYNGNNDNITNITNITTTTTTTTNHNNNNNNNDNDDTKGPQPYSSSGTDTGAQDKENYEAGGNIV